MPKYPILKKTTRPIEPIGHAQMLGDLVLDGEGPVYEQIYRSIRAAILSGRCESGMRIPSSRGLALDLSVSRTTVNSAYDQLLAEGYVTSRTGSGTFVASEVQGHPCVRDPWELPEESASVREPRLSRYGRRIVSQHPRKIYDELKDRAGVAIDFMPCVPARQSRSAEAWSKSLKVVGQNDLQQVRAYGDPAGDPTLRSEIAAYLGRARGIACSAEDVLIVSGVSQSLMLCAQLLVDEGDRVLLEDPHHLGARRAFQAVGASLETAPVDTEGINLAAIANQVLSECRVAYVTPSHQFPAGSVLSLARRKALLDWASLQNAYVIEDDYDSEYRYVGRPIEPLKSLDVQERVIYTGSFSKVLDPALRLGFMVPPPSLFSLLRETRWLFDWSSSALEQRAMAHMIGAGEFERHLRRCRTVYGRKRSTLLDALASTFGDTVQYYDSGAGLHIMIEFPDVAVTEVDRITREAQSLGVLLYPGHIYSLRPPSTAKFMMGFTLVREAEILEGVRVLEKVLRVG